jgi:hypothetical protein
MPPSSEAIVARTIQKAAVQMAVEYRTQRANDAERLYEALASVVGEQQPAVEVLIFVLELLKHSVLDQKTRELFPTAGESVVIPVAVRGYGGLNGHDLEASPLRD